MSSPTGKSTAGVFDAYAEYYDLLYQDKDYAAEARAVHDRLKMGGMKGTRLLELGCGTGRHAVEFAQLGYAVTGVDLSEGMVRQAITRTNSLPDALAERLSFQAGDVRTVKLSQSFDAVVSLFHVMCYQTSSADLKAAFHTASRHLSDGGLFLFDFWYGPAVLSDPPVVRVKRLGNESVEVTRIAEPTIQPNENSVQVDYQVFVRNKQNREVTEIREAHRMRYLFLPEIETSLATEGLTLLASGAWTGSRPLGMDTWYGWALARKKAPGAA